MTLNQTKLLVANDHMLFKVIYILFYIQRVFSKIQKIL